MRVALHTRVKPGRESEYDQAHREVPAELVEAIKRGGAHEWTIWRSGRDLFHVIECDDYEALLSSPAGLPANITWQARMAELLEVTHDYSEDGAGKGLPAVWRLP
ncbi:L-rhamnose mutarotase [Streptosporangium sp. NPDC001681]|uniref:L-rhamnose mutarotase n=1 Tax=Streptosporangium sp. NPDC001681 TaxID=3154395 RepID=UPI0033241792